MFKKYKDSILLVILAIGLVVLCLYQLHPKIGSLLRLHSSIRTNTQQLADLDRQLNELKVSDKLKDQQNELFAKKIYKPGDSGLDTEASFSVMFDDLIEMAKYNSVKMYSIAYTYNPSDDAFIKGAVGQFNVCQINMQMIADYVDFNEFLKAIYKYPYLICIDEIELKPYTKNKRILLINVQLKLYSAK